MPRLKSNQAQTAYNARKGKKEERTTAEVSIARARNKPMYGIAWYSSTTYTGVHVYVYIYICTYALLVCMDVCMHVCIYEYIG